MDKITSWILVSALATPLLFGCETSNHNYSSGRVVDGNSRTSTSSGRTDSVIEQSIRAPANRPGSQGSLVEETLPESEAVTVGRDLTHNAASSKNGGKPLSSSVVEESVDGEEQPLVLPNMAGIASQFEGAVASNDGYYQPAQPVSRPVPTQNVTIPSSIPVPQQQQTVSRPAPAPAPAPAAKAAAPAADQSQQSTSSGNWLLVDSKAAQQDASNSAKQAAAQNSTAVSYKASQTPTAGPDQYRVVKGDTLYSIAFRYGLDYRKLAEINKIEPPYSLSVGQVLTLKLKASAPKAYEVQKGDTLYSIARKNNQSVAVLASVNNLEPPYSLTVGQKIYLSRDEATNASSANKGNMEVPVAGQKEVASATKPSSSSSASKPSSSSSTTAATKPSQTTTTAAKTPVVNSKTRKVSGVTWSWPTSGRVVEQFSTAEQGNKGLDIEGKRGQAIFSAADGQVVYSGNALRGFGNLIIINHSNEFLSAYAHNDALLVKEGQKVKRGQQIARMGNTDAASVRLHFEVRYRGQSVNPLNYLPK